jgi:hypothetical protein
MKPGEGMLPECPVAELPDKALPVWDLALSVVFLQDPADQRQAGHELAALDSAVLLHKHHTSRLVTRQRSKIFALA